MSNEQHRLANPVIISCSNLKGGEGKTTIARHLVHYASEVLGLRVLAADFDPQGNLTDSLTSEKASARSSTADLYADDFDLAGVSVLESATNISVLPANKKSLEALAEVAGGRKALVSRASSNLRAVAKGYDVVIVDTPTNAPLCYLAGIAASDGSVSPVQMDVYGLRGATDFVKELPRVRATYNARHKHLGFVVNRFNARAKSHAEILDQARASNLPILDTVIRDRIAVQDALSRAMPVWRGPRGTVNRNASKEFKTMCREVFAAVGVDLAKVGA